MKASAPTANAGFPLPLAVIVLLCAAYLIVGNVGHDPWKADDAVHLGIAYDLHTGDDWLPRIAGEVWMGVIPAYHWVAAATAWLTQWLLPFHDGARLATALFGALFLFFLARSAAVLYEANSGLVAPVLAIGTLGLLVPIHDAQPAVAVLAASAFAYYGLARLQQTPISAALIAGLGYGCAFLAGGLAGVSPLLPLLLLPLLQKSPLVLGVTLLSAVTLAAIWPALLAVTHPELLRVWWNEELAAATLSSKTFSRDHLELLAWFAWPTLPLGAWAVWASRRQWREWHIALPLLGTVVALIWFFYHEARPLAALPLLTPLTLLASGGAHKLRRGAANAFNWFGMMTFTLVIGLIWLGGIAMWIGLPTQIARNFAKLEPGFDMQFSVGALALALAFSTAWIAALTKLPRSPWNAAIRWGTGIVAMWGVLVALWFPWIDYGKTYRGVATALRHALPRNSGCVSGRDIGPAQRAVIDYFAGIRTQAETKTASCRWLLVLGSAHQEPAPAGWRKTWEGNRPGDKSERLRLYRRDE